MSETRHTPEPPRWHVGNPTPLRPTYTVYNKPFGLGDIAEVYEEGRAERIVACVNALAGVDDPAAELARLRRVEEAARALWAASPDRVRVEHWDALDAALGDGS